MKTAAPPLAGSQTAFFPLAPKISTRSLVRLGNDLEGEGVAFADEAVAEVVVVVEGVEVEVELD